MTNNKTAVKGNLLKGTADKMLEHKNLESCILCLCTYVLLSVTHFFEHRKKWFKIAGFPKIFLNGNLYMTNIVCKS